MPERLQKIIAAAGIASRRKAEELLVAGRVTVNGVVVTELGTKADPEHDEIRVDGTVVEAEPTLVVYALNKPVGVVSTRLDSSRPRRARSNERDRQSMIDLVPKQPPVYPVGRLDRMSEGLLLLTNDGALAHELTHPKFVHEKEYELTGVTKAAPDAVVERLKAGVRLTDGKFTPDRVELAGFRHGQPIFRVVIHEGRSHLLRRAAAQVGLEITRLRRVRIGQFPLGNLPPGKFRQLSEAEIGQLRAGRPND